MRLSVLVLLLATSLFAGKMSIQSDDGFKLHGWLEYPESEKKTYPVAVFAHQFGSDHSIWDELAKKLRDRGFATMLIDLRGHGKSIKKNGKTVEIVNEFDMAHIEEAFDRSSRKVGFEHIPQDIAYWLDALGTKERLDMNRLVLFGSSLGGGAILPLMLDYEPAAVVAISPGSSSEEATETSLMYAQSPSLFIAGKNDPLGAQQRALEYADKAYRGTYIMLSSNGHGTVLLPWVEDYIFTFLGENVPYGKNL